MSESITCFNGNECSYNTENRICPFFNPIEGDVPLDGTCLLEPMKGTKKAPAPVAQPTSRAPKKQETPQNKTGNLPIGELEEGHKGSKNTPLNIKGTVVFDPEQRDVDTNSGPSTVTSIVIEDETGKAKISFWGNKNDQILDFQKGDILFFDGLYRVKEPYKDTVQIDGGKYYKVVKLN